MGNATYKIIMQEAQTTHTCAENYIILHWALVNIFYRVSKRFSCFSTFLTLIFFSNVFYIYP